MTSELPCHDQLITDAHERMFRLALQRHGSIPATPAFRAREPMCRFYVVTYASRQSGRNAAPGEAIPSTGQFWQAKGSAPAPCHHNVGAIRTHRQMHLSLLRKCQIQRTTFRALAGSFCRAPQIDRMDSANCLRCVSGRVAAIKYAALSNLGALEERLLPSTASAISRNVIESGARARR